VIRAQEFQHRVGVGELHSSTGDTGAPSSARLTQEPLLNGMLTKSVNDGSTLLLHVPCIIAASVSSFSTGARHHAT
jgi:hypothetical protein